MPAAPALWRFNHKILRLAAGCPLRVEASAPAVAHWTADGWHTVTDTATQDRGWAVHAADLPASQRGAGAAIQFTLYWPEGDRWEGEDFLVAVEPAPATTP